MKIVRLCLFLLSMPAVGALLPSDRVVDWSQAGVPGGVPTYAVWTNMSGLDASGATDCSAAIQTALDACPPFQAVKLPAGTFKLTNGIALTHTNVLRGSGTNLTTLLIAGVYPGSWAGVRIGSSQGGDTTWDVVPATAVKGATSIYCTSVSGLVASNVVCIEQQNDNVMVFNFSDEGGALGQDWYYSTNYNLAQMVEIRSVSGTNITFWPPLNWSYTNASLLPKIHRKSGGNYVWGCGLEDVTVGQTGSNGEKNIDFAFTKFSWVTRVLSTNCYKYHVQLIGALGCEVRDSLFVGAQGSTSGGSYGISLALGSTSCRIENNAINNVITGVILAEMAQGNVIGYNYVFRTQYSPTNWLQAAFSSHDAHPLMNLYEGNVGGSFISDNIHGSSSHTTFFRNRLIGAQTQGIGTTNWTTHQNRGLQWDNHNWYGIGVGNVIGNTNVVYTAFTNGPNTLSLSVPVLETFGYTSLSPGTYTDTNSFYTAILLGNYLIGTGADGVPARESLGGTNLEASLYLAAKPSWFGTVRFPPIGPDVSGYTNAIPAQLRFHGESWPGERLLVITEPVARGYLGTRFDDWLYQIRREGTFQTITVVEVSRFIGGNDITNDWSGLRVLSNAVVQFNPTAVQLVGRLPQLQTGGHSCDGHEIRRILTHAWLGCLPGLTFSDTLNWSLFGMAGGGVSATIATNAPGDGFPDETQGTFSIPVAHIDASGLTNKAGTFSTGYFSGQAVLPAVDEATALQSYFDWNLACRRQAWSNSITGYIDSSLVHNYAYVVATNTAVVWTQSSDNTLLRGADYLWVYDQIQTSDFSQYYFTAGGSPLTARWIVGTKSYNHEAFEGQSADGGTKYSRRRLFPGFTGQPLCLVYTWAKSVFATPSQWVSKSGDLTVADAIRTSVVSWNGGGGGPYSWQWDTANVHGDLTLPLGAITQIPPGRATVHVLSITK